MTRLSAHHSKVWPQKMTEGIRDHQNTKAYFGISEVGETRKSVFDCCIVTLISMFIIQVVHNNVDTEKEKAKESNEIMLFESLFGVTKLVKQVCLLNCALCF